MKLLTWVFFLTFFVNEIQVAQADQTLQSEACAADATSGHALEGRSSSLLQKDTRGTKMSPEHSSGQKSLELLQQSQPALAAAAVVAPSRSQAYWLTTVMVLGSMLGATKLPSFRQSSPRKAADKMRDAPGKDSIKGTVAQDTQLKDNIGLLRHDPPAAASSLLELLPDVEDVAMCQDGADPAPVSYSELRGLLGNPDSAAELSECFGPEDRVALVLDNGKDMAVCLLAVMHVACAVPLNPGFTELELRASMEQLKCTAVVLRPGPAGEAARGAAQSLGLRALTLCPGEASGKLLALEGPRLARKLSDDAGKSGLEASAQERVVLLLKTSGTTSKGKVVTFTLERLSLAARYNACCVALGQGSVCLSMMPLFHIAGISVNFLASMSAGATVLFYSGSFEVTRFAAELERPDKFKPTWYFAVPAVHEALLSYVVELGCPLKHQLTLIRSAGAALLQQTGLRLIEAFDCSVTPAYGMTEALEITCHPVGYRLERPGSVGPTISADISLAAGEVCIRGDLVMPGYEFHGPHEEDPNAEAWTSGGNSKGFLRTGDLGHLDKDGWLYLTGRSKEMINRGGETINPHEIEPALVSKPEIEVVVCFAAPHLALGECVACVVVLKEGFGGPQDVSPDSLLEHCSLMLSATMRPEVFVYAPREVLPTTATKKFIRAGLAQRVGLTSELMSSGASSFVYNKATGLLDPSFLGSSATVKVKDSLGQLRDASLNEASEQRVKQGLFGLGIMQVMTKHWYEGNYGDAPIPVSFIISFECVASCLMLFMTLFFLLTGHTASQIKTGRQLRERWLGIYVLLLTSSFIALSTNSIRVDWYFAWLLFAEVTVAGIDFMWSSLPESLGDVRKDLSAASSILAFLFLAIWFNALRPQSFYHALGDATGWGPRNHLGETWANLFLGPVDFCLGEWFWGLLFVWAASFSIGFHFLPRLSKAVWARPEVLAGLSRPSVRLVSAAGVAFLIALHPGWPSYLAGWWWPWAARGTHSMPVEFLMDSVSCISNMLHTYLVIFLMAVAIGGDSRRLQGLGKNAIGALVSHTAFSRGTQVLYGIHADWWLGHDALHFGLLTSQPAALVIIMVFLPAIYLCSVGKWMQGVVDLLLRKPLLSCVLLLAFFWTLVTPLGFLLAGVLLLTCSLVYFGPRALFSDHAILDHAVLD
ncbi:unnamed protein product [Polarella glacialis]|uniref:Uncharacterized protein n=1 Tax=Polarella glacialis TaxID=89957 RepID=A0A813KCT0_POLGL|nr:unnamed protein product [Polarella glacialis]